MNYLGNFIKKWINEKNISERELARQCKVSHSYLNQLISGINPKTQKAISPTLGTLEKISTGIGLSLDAIQKIASGVPEETLMETDTNRIKFLNNLEKVSNKEGVLVGSKSNRVISWDTWNQIKQAQVFLDSVGIDPSQHSEEDWADLISDISLIVKIHSEKRNKV